jgi:DHA2 family multidrug resistance protein-like MFS transporter
MNSVLSSAARCARNVYVQEIAVTVACMHSPSAPRAAHRDWIALAVMALPCLVYTMDLTVLDVALPTISTNLRPTAVQLLWIADVYGFMVAGSLITMGTLGDRIGRRRLLLIGAGSFALASFAAAFASGPGTLIAARALMGVAGATFAPSTLSLIRNMFHDSKERTIAVSVWAAAYSAGGALGPLLGGALLTYFWWGSVFLVGVPVMVLLLLVAPRLVPEFRDPAPARLDLPSATLSLAAVVAVMFGLKQIAQNGVNAFAVLALSLGVSLAIVFVYRQRSLSQPLIDPRLLRVRYLRASLAIYTLGTFVAFGIYLFVTQYIQIVLGLGPLEAGLWTLPFAAAFVAGSLASPYLVRRWPPGCVMSAGSLLAALGLSVLTLVETLPSLALIEAGFIVYSLGLAPMFTLTNDLIVSAAPRERAGAASAISETASEFGGALGVAALGSLSVAVYGSATGPNVLARALTLVAAVCAGIALLMAIIAARSLMHNTADESSR